MNKEIMQNLKRKIIKLEETVKQINQHKFILINIFNELNERKNIKLSNVLYGIDLQEEISYLDDWAEFHSKDIEKHETRLKRLKQAIREEALEKKIKEKGIEPEIEKKTEESFKLIFKVEEKPKKAEVSDLEEEKPAKKALKEKILGLRKVLAQTPFLKYAIPIVVLALIITSLFLLKPSITGYVVLEKEAVYSENLNIQVNESGIYEWQIKNPGNIKSIKSTGSVVGNGSVSVYIEKDGKRYLIYQTNKVIRHS